MATGKRQYVASHFALELEQMGLVGFLRSAEGGGLKADILTYQQGSTQDNWRQAGRPKFDDITVSVGMGLSPTFYTWISAFFERKGERRHGALVTADFDYFEMARRTFTQALISQVDLPALDAAKSEAAYMSVKLVPEMVTFDPPKGKTQISAPQGKNQPAKQWQCSNFGLTIHGFEDACSRVTKVEQFTIKQQILEYPSGHQRFPIRVAGKLEYPNIIFYVPSVDADKFTEAAKKRLVDFEAPSATRLTGAITYLTPTKQTLCTVNLYGVDVIYAEPQKFEASADTLHTVKVQIQVERMDFKYEQQAIG